MEGGSEEFFVFRGGDFLRPTCSQTEMLVHNADERGAKSLFGVGWSGLEEHRSTAIGDSEKMIVTGRRIYGMRGANRCLKFNISDLIR